MIGVHKDNESKGKAEGFEESRFGRWYLAEEECGNVAGSTVRKAESMRRDWKGSAGACPEGTVT